LRTIKYWAKSRVQKALAGGKSLALFCWGWSENAREDAEAKAEERLVKALSRVSSGGDASAYYDANPMREAVIREGKDDGSGNLDFIITQNVYGCYVINTEKMMFVDIDISPEEAAPASGSLVSTVLGFLFGSPVVKKEEVRSLDPKEAAEEKYIELLKKTAAADPDFSARVYRTCAGLRYIVTNRGYDPAADETVNFLNSLKCDPMYVRLCRVQKTFRARLTPKPWRCGVSNIHISYPYENAVYEKIISDWMRHYNAAGSTHATCRYLFTVGNGNSDRSFEEMIKLHDEMTRTDSGLKLA